ARADMLHTSHRDARAVGAALSETTHDAAPLLYLLSAAGRPAGNCLLSFVELRVDEKAVQEALQEMKDQPLFPVKKAQSDEVAIEPVEECAEKQGLREVYRCP